MTRGSLAPPLSPDTSRIEVRDASASVRVVLSIFGSGGGASAMRLESAHPSAQNSAAEIRTLVSAAFDSSGHVLDRELATALLRAHERLTRARLPALVRPDGTHAARLARSELQAVLLAAAGCGHLVVSRARVDVPAAPLPRVEAPPPKVETTAPEATTTWVALRLVDQDGAAVGRRGYRLELPDGRELQGFLDPAGRTRHDDVPNGTCVVTFPDLDVSDFGAPRVLGGREDDQTAGAVAASENGDDARLVHRIQTGETLSSVADDHGFLHFATLWAHSDNAGLRARREHPHVLLEGDEVVVPPKTPKQLRIPVGRETTLTVFVEKLAVRLRAERRAGEVVPIRVGEVDVDGDARRATSAGGVLHVPIPRSARKLRIFGQEEAIEASIGSMPPATEPSGVDARLANLGLAPRRATEQTADRSPSADVFDYEWRELGTELLRERNRRPPQGEASRRDRDDLKKRAGV